MQKWQNPHPRHSCPVSFDHKKGQSDLLNSMVIESKSANSEAYFCNIVPVNRFRVGAAVAVDDDGSEEVVDQ